MPTMNEASSRRPGGPTVVGAVVLALTLPAIVWLAVGAWLLAPVPPPSVGTPVLTIGLFFLGVSLVFHGSPGSWRALAGNTLALVSATLGLATLGQAALADAGATHAWLDSRTEAPGLVALGLVAIGISLGTGPRSRASIRSGLVGLGAGVLIVLGGAYELDRLPGSAGSWSSIPGVTTLLAALGALLRHQELGLVAALRARDEVGAALRRSLIAAVVVPSVFGRLALEGNRAGLYGDATGTALLAAASMTALAIVAFVSSRGVRRANAARVAADTALEASEARYRRIFDRASVGIAQLSEDGRWLQVNERLCEMFGRTRAELQTKTYADLGEVDDLALDAQSWARLRRGEIEEFAVERRFVRKDGAMVDADVRVVRENDASDGDGLDPARYVAVLQDVTARNAFENSLRVYERAISATQSGVVIADARKPDHPIISVNASFERITGYAAAEVLGQNCRFLNQGARGQAGLATLRRAIEAGESCSVLLRNFRANGEGFWNSVSVAPVHDTEGRITHFVGAMLDSTEQVQLLAERESLLQIADEGRRAAETANEAKDRFLSVVSHELRSPMNAVISWASLLRDETDPSKRSEGLDAIEASMRAQTRLVDDLLDTSRIRSGGLGIEIARVDLASAVGAVFARHLAAAEARRVELALRLPIEPAACRADHQRVDQILDNLLENAIKFTSAGGRVELELSESEGMWEIRVSDTGRGLSAEARDHLFEEFWQADARGGRGLGLGLAIVKHLVERQDGTVEVESPGPGLGTTFRVTLPILREPERESNASPRSPRAIQGEIDPIAGAVVVVVDDYRPTALAFAAAFERAGATARVAGSVDEALVLLADSPAALVSDIGMPDRDGLDLIQTLRGSALPGREIPAIAVTAHAGIEDRQRIQRAGFDACLAKPVKPQEVVERLASLRMRLMQPAPVVRRLIVYEDERTRAAGLCDGLRAAGHDVIAVSEAKMALNEAIESGCDAILVAEPIRDPAVERLAKRASALRQRPAYVGLYEAGAEPARSISDFLVPLREPKALQRVLCLLEDHPR